MKTIILLPIIMFVMQCANKKATQSDYSVNDIWVLEELAGFEHSLTGPKGNPTLEVHLNDSTYYGHGGCNSLSGKIKVDGEKVKFLPALMTKMYCEDKGLERYYLEALHEVNGFKVESLKLTLTKDEEVIAVFKKVD